MQTRKLGRTGLEVAVIGLGTEYLVGAPRETVISAVQEAAGRGVNYVAVLFSYPDYRDNLGAAFDGLRDGILVAGHIGAAETNGQYRRTRDIAECEFLFEDLLSRLRTDHVDVAVLQYVDEEDDYAQVMGPGGLLELAQRYQAEGKARFIGMSGHKVPVALKAAQSGQVDVLMHNVSLMLHSAAGMTELLRACMTERVGLVGMKAFAGGELLRRSATPAQCLSYALSQPGVCTSVPGVRNLDELRATLAYLEASEEERDFSAVLADVAGNEAGTCVYCNHCLPCPVGINIGEILRLPVAAGEHAPPSLLEEYRLSPVKASECTECGACMDRCPFGVDVVSRMKEAGARLER